MTGRVDTYINIGRCGLAEAVSLIFCLFTPKSISRYVLDIPFTLLLGDWMPVAMADHIVTSSLTPKACIGEDGSAHSSPDCLTGLLVR